MDPQDLEISKLSTENARLRSQLAEAEAERDALREALTALHGECDVEGRGVYCDECRQVWPCRTIRALSASRHTKN